MLLCMQISEGGLSKLRYSWQRIPLEIDWRGRWVVRSCAAFVYLSCPLHRDVISSLINRHFVQPDFYGNQQKLRGGTITNLERGPTKTLCFQYFREPLIETQKFVVNWPPFSTGHNFERLGGIFTICEIYFPRKSFKYYHHLLLYFYNAPHQCCYVPTSAKLKHFVWLLPPPCQTGNDVKRWRPPPSESSIWFKCATRGYFIWSSLYFLIEKEVFCVAANFSPGDRVVLYAGVLLESWNLHRKDLRLNDQNTDIFNCAVFLRKNQDGSITHSQVLSGKISKVDFRRNCCVL